MSKSILSALKYAKATEHHNQKIWEEILQRDDVKKHIEKLPKKEKLTLAENINSWKLWVHMFPLQKSA
jgi:hypothetical protein